MHYGAFKVLIIRLIKWLEKDFIEYKQTVACFIPMLQNRIACHGKCLELAMHIVVVLKLFGQKATNNFFQDAGAKQVIKLKLVIFY